MQKYDPSIITKRFSRINVPSRGLYYPNKKDCFLVKHLSYNEEYVLSDHYIMDTEEGIALVLDSVILDDFDVEQLLPGDVQAISLLLHSTAYGDTLTIKTKCPNCGVESEKQIKISDFSMKKPKVLPNDDGVLEGFLPESQKKVIIRVPTFFEEFRFSKMHKDRYLEKLMFLSREIDGRTEEGYIRQFIRNMPIRDSRYLKRFLEDNIPGVDNTIPTQCPSCHSKYSTVVNTGHNFLTLPEDYLSNVREEVFLCYFYGENLGLTGAMSLSVEERKWHLNRINKERKKINEREEKAASGAGKLRSKSHRFKK